MGVVLYVGSYLSIAVPFFWVTVVPFLFTVTSGFVLFVAAVLPGNPHEVWGSIWPLSGYDNAIDAIYTRGPWWQRFYELDEQEAENRTTAAMATWF